MKKLLFILTLFASTSAAAQLPDGSIAPDFTLTDYYGVEEHNLYAYLDQGKTVFVEIFAAHCSACWSYHQTHKMKDLYNQYGPEGTDEVMVLALEYDYYNDSTAFTGNHEPWVTQGDWLTGTPYPIFNVEDPDRGVFEDYVVTFYPVIYKVCPDRLTERVSISDSLEDLYEMLEGCQSVSLDEELALGAVYLSQSTLHIDQYESVNSVEVINLQGQVVQQIAELSDANMAIKDLQQGIYMFRINTDQGAVMHRFYLD